MIVGSGAYRDGERIDTAPVASRYEDLVALARTCTEGSDFVWLGLLDPSPDELAHAAAAFGLHPLAVEDALATHERPKVDVHGDTLTIVVRPARYLDEPETVEFGQITMMAAPNHVVVVRHGDAVPLTDLRTRMESDPEWLREGPGAVVHAIIDEVVEAYGPVLLGIADDIDEVEEVVFSTSRESPTQRIYELKREVLEFSKSTTPLVEVLEDLVTLEHPVLSEELHRYFSDTDDQLARVVDQVQTDRELLTSVLEANLTQVSVRQNEDMRKISAWVAIAAVPTMVAGIYGMNFRHMPELETRYGYFVVLALITVSCLALYRSFKRSGWL
ncbi:MAG TPA: magnesium/cobalt transporter CorA [Microthrixaceae bacterium]|jgi:magnesium transporter|nr:magnesium/cobalt transporter CorA [Microthrixaceae bacterium]